MDTRGWQLQVFDNGQLLDLSKTNKNLFKVNETKVLELRYLEYETILPDIQVNVCQGDVEIELNGRFLNVTPRKNCDGLLSFFIPHNDDETNIDTIELLSFTINE